MVKAVNPYVSTLSETDRDRTILNNRVHQIMSGNLVTIAIDMSIEAAARLLLDHRVSCLAVVTAKGHLEGIVTRRNLLREYLSRKS